MDRTPAPARRFLPPSSSSVQRPFPASLIKKTAPTFSQLPPSSSSATTFSRASRFQTPAKSQSDGISTSFHEDDEDVSRSKLQTFIPFGLTGSDAIDEENVDLIDVPRTRQIDPEIDSDTDYAGDQASEGFHYDIETPLPKRRRISNKHIGSNEPILLSSSPSGRLLIEDEAQNMPDDYSDLDDETSSPTRVTKSPRVISRFKKSTPAPPISQNLEQKPVFRPLDSTTHMAAEITTVLPEAFTPSRKKGKRDYVPGGLADMVRNTVLSIAPEVGQEGGLDEKVIMITSATLDISGRAILATDSDDIQWILPEQNGHDKPEALVKRLEDIRSSGQISIFGEATHWSLRLDHADGHSETRFAAHWDAPNVLPRHGTLIGNLLMAKTMNTSNEALKGVRADYNNVISARSTYMVVCIAIFATYRITQVKGYRRLRRDAFRILAIAALLCSKNAFGIASRHRPSMNLILTAGVGVTVITILARRATRKAPLIDSKTFTTPLRPMIFPCRTIHTRLFPTTHSLSYSYLFVGIPVDWNGSTSSILSAGNSGASTWFSVHQEDYLARGTHPNGLQGKLQDYLLSQDADLSLTTHAYLVTAPRFLGFSFNPVSFWYLYSPTMTLQHMILEVNNTFDERRMYLLNTNVCKDPSTKYKSEWKKDFHVSPFNDRSGSYSLSALDPFTHPDAVRVDNNIVLKADDGKPKLIARVFSTENGIEAVRFTQWQAFVFVLKWWWVGFMTNPRILRQAWVLWVKKLKVFYRPEVNVGSIGRNEMAEEGVLEGAFLRYLQALSRESQRGIVYTPAAGPKRGCKVHIEIENAHGDARTRQPHAIELEVLTPEFYSELARKRNVWDLIDTRCLNAELEDRMAALNQEGLDVLPELCAANARITEARKIQESNKSRSSFRKTLNANLRDGVSLFIAVICAFGSLVGIRHTSIGEEWVVSSTCEEEKEMMEFERACTTVLLADRLALGSITLLRVYVSVVRWSVIIMSAWQISGLIVGKYGLTQTIWFSFAMKVGVLLLCR